MKKKQNAPGEIRTREGAAEGLDNLFYAIDSAASNWILNLLTPIRESWKKIQKSGTELASFLEKNPDLKSGLDFFSRNDAYSFPEIRFFQKSHQNN